MGWPDGREVLTCVDEKSSRGNISNVLGAEKCSNAVFAEGFEENLVVYCYQVILAFWLERE